MKEPYMKQFQFLMLSLFITTAGLNAMETEKPASSPISIPKKIRITTHPTPVNQSPDDVRLNAAVVAMALTQISKEEDATSQGDTSSHEGQGRTRNDDREYYEDEHDLNAGEYEAGTPEGEYYALKASNARQRKINNRKK